MSLVVTGSSLTVQDADRASNGTSTTAGDSCCTIEVQSQSSRHLGLIVERRQPPSFHPHRRSAGNEVHGLRRTAALGQHTLRLAILAVRD
jgi:hypothetical protein